MYIFGMVSYGIYCYGEERIDHVKHAACGCLLGMILQEMLFFFYLGTLRFFLGPHKACRWDVEIDFVWNQGGRGKKSGKISLVLYKPCLVTCILHVLIFRWHQPVSLIKIYQFKQLTMEVKLSVQFRILIRK